MVQDKHWELVQVIAEKWPAGIKTTPEDDAYIKEHQDDVWFNGEEVGHINATNRFDKNTWHFIFFPLDNAGWYRPGYTTIQGMIDAKGELGVFRGDIRRIAKIAEHHYGDGPAEDDTYEGRTVTFYLLYECTDIIRGEDVIQTLDLIGEPNINAMHYSVNVFSL